MSLHTDYDMPLHTHCDTNQQDRGTYASITSRGGGRDQAECPKSDRDHHTAASRWDRTRSRKLSALAAILLCVCVCVCACVSVSLATIRPCRSRHTVRHLNQQEEDQQEETARAGLASPEKNSRKRAASAQESSRVAGGQRGNGWQWLRQTPGKA